MQRPLIYTKNLDITYNLGKSNEFKALADVNIEIYPREYVILFGPSGSGKSTLLYSIFGVLRPSSGKVFVKGDSIYDYSAQEMVEYQRNRTGIMYQKFNLISSITVLDNVSLPLIFAGISPIERERRASKLLERYGITQVAHKRPTMLSGGQQQRVSVARSLVNNPEILIADEPVGNLDSISAKAVMDTLEEINERDQKTVILVTHDAKHLPYAHRVIYLKDGAVERIVSNPEKKQIKKTKSGETIVTEIEQLARLFPYASIEDLRVKSIVNYCTQDLSFDQLVRLERFTREVIQGNFDRGIFLHTLLEEYDKGGVGADVEFAQKIALKTEQILKRSHEILRYRRSGHETQSVDTSMRGIVKDITDFLLKENDLEISAIQSRRLEDSVKNRIGGFIEKEEFKEQVRSPVEKGGAGIGHHLTHEVSRYLEKLIAQGVPR